MSDKEAVEKKVFTLNELVSMRDVLQSVFTAKLPVKISFRLQKFLKLVNTEYEVFEKFRLEMFKEYGEEKDDQLVIKPESLTTFTNEMNDLLNQEVEVSLIPTKLSALEGRLSVSPIEMAKVERLFDTSDIVPTLEHVQFTIQELINMREAMQKLFEAKLNVSTAYLLSKYFLQVVNSEFEEFEKKRFELFKEYGQEDEVGHMTVKPENVETFTENLNALLADEFYLDIQQAKLDDLDSVEFTAIEASLLDKVLVE